MKMKMIVSAVIFILIVGLSSVSMAEDYPQKGATAVSIDSYSRVLFKKMMTDDYALSFGILLNARFWDSSHKDRESDFLIGLRSYTEKGRYNRFIDVDLAFLHYHTENSYSSYWAQDYSLRIYYGLEHFLKENLSIGGRAGISATYTESRYSDNREEYRLPVSDIALTYYW